MSMSTPALLRAIFVMATIGLTFWATSTFLRRGFPDAWHRWVKKLSMVSVVVALVGVVGWQGPRSLGYESPTAFFFLTITSAVLMSFLMLAVTSPVWGTAAVTTRKLPKNPGRRQFLRGVTSTMPLAAASTGPIGAASASSAPTLTAIDVKSSRVPKDLDGFTILQLSDVHLGVFIHKDQFSAVIDAVNERGVVPDAIVLTGDIADDLAQLPGALEELTRLVPREKTFACIGNHEIYRGREKAIAHYNDAGVTFLCNRGVVVTKNGARLWMAGADDPARGLDGDDGFLEHTVERSLADCPPDVTCKVLMSHRPRGWVAARDRGVTLTLSGHTHGTQMGLLGRSILSPLWPESFLWGHYRSKDGADGALDDDECHLYTSAGLGHWMPFRLNCPCEAVLVTLRAAPAPTP